jgi:Transposase DDE domain
MPYKHNQSRRHKIEKARYKVTNWPEYNKALRQRGDITIWLTEEALAAWRPAKTGARGRPQEYSDLGKRDRSAVLDETIFGEIFSLAGH